ncbi:MULTISPECIES: Crp/Fnr family transcriptional regulator [unclassified Adlercreutzia]|uniref:Crp/Fnr family transcriptional regulator n=1 Tax=unclassified Adlercreutzia TaxID=2636013 RepID=UPI0013EE05B8|nr:MULTISPECIES: Crp/Fnr family transcriptional regulator [unclassified Adlercreutzia]
MQHHPTTIDHEALARLPLFEGIPAEKLKQVLICLKAQQRCYAKDETIFHSGDNRRTAGVLARGCAANVWVDREGNRSIISEYAPGSIIAGDALTSGVAIAPLDVVATRDCVVVSFSMDVRVTGCERCRHYADIVQENATKAIMQMNEQMARRICVLSERSVRGKITSFLAEQAEKAGSRSFTIDFDRQQLADYLFVERTALSRELGKMRREGLIACERNEFTLLGE